MGPNTAKQAKANLKGQFRLFFLLGLISTQSPLFAEEQSFCSTVWRAISLRFQPKIVRAFLPSITEFDSSRFDWAGWERLSQDERTSVILFAVRNRSSRGAYINIFSEFPRFWTRLDEIHLAEIGRAVHSTLSVPQDPDFIRLIAPSIRSPELRFQIAEAAVKAEGQFPFVNGVVKALRLSEPQTLKLIEQLARAGKLEIGRFGDEKSPSNLSSLESLERLVELQAQYGRTLLGAALILSFKEVPLRQRWSLAALATERLVSPAVLKELKAVLDLLKDENSYPDPKAPEFQAAATKLLDMYLHDEMTSGLQIPIFRVAAEFLSPSSRKALGLSWAAKTTPHYDTAELLGLSDKEYGELQKNYLDHVNLVSLPYLPDDFPDSLKSPEHLKSLADRYLDRVFATRHTQREMGIELSYFLRGSWLFNRRDLAGRFAALERTPHFRGKSNAEVAELTHYLMGISEGGDVPLVMVKAKANELSLERPDLFPPKVLEFLQSVGNEAAYHRLLLTLVTKNFRREIDLNKLPATPLAFAASELNLPGETFQKLSPASASYRHLLNVFCDLSSMNAAEWVDRAKFEGIGSKEMQVNASEWLEYFRTLRDLHYVRISPSQIRGTMFPPDKPLTSTSISPRLEAGLKLLQTTLVADLKEAGFSGFSSKHFQKLREKWGDLEPIYTLLARYKGDPKWRAELPIVGRIFQANLGGWGEEYKFDGFRGDRGDREAAKAQLASLKTKEQQALWRREVTVGAVAKAEDLRDFNGGEWLLKYVHEQLNATLFGHLAELTRNPQISKDTINGMADRVRSAKSEVELRDALNALGLTLSSIKPRYSERGLFMEIRAEITDARAKLNPTQESNKNTKYLVVSTLFHDTKPLMTIGDLVKTPSCQNYRTGHLVQSLPGYVIDANVKGLASFILDPSQFEKHSDFEKAADFLRKDPSGVRVDWGTNQIRFGDTVSLAVPHAYVRQMVKLGTTGGGSAGLAREPTYLQAHLANRFALRQMDSLFSQFAGNLGASTAEEITVSESRNPLGVYSDRSGGIMEGSYKIH